MDTIIFEISGKFAHFRRFYTNSSSLTYGAPTRTNVVGLVAAILGYDRDEYYENFSRDKFKVAIEKINKTRRLTQTMNYLKVLSPKHFYNPQDHTQIPLEILTSNKEVKYKIYVSHINTKIMDHLELRLSKNQPAYPIYLGIAPFLAKITYIKRMNLKGYTCSDYLEVKSLINRNYIEDIKIEESDKYVLVKEKMPVEFLKNRIPKKAEYFIYDENCQSIRIKTNQLVFNDNTNNIIFI